MDLTLTPDNATAHQPSRLPVVSVIMIFLNAERFIEEAIASVLAQTFRDWELILVDDGSSDSSVSIAQHYAARHPDRIIYSQHDHHQNLGMSASRNRGISRARGRYIAFLDADDVYRPEKLERQVAVLEREASAAMVYGPTEYWFSWSGQSDRRDRLRKLGVLADTLVPPPALAIKYLRGDARTPGTCGVLIRRQAILEIDGFEERFRGMFEDQVFFYRLSLRYPVYVMGESLDRYRQQPQSHSQQMLKSGGWSRTKPNAATYVFLIWLREYLIAEQIDNPVIWRLLKTHLREYEHPWQHRLLTLAGRRHRLARSGATLWRRLCGFAGAGM